MREWLKTQFTTFPTFKKLGKAVASKMPDSVRVAATDFDLGVRAAVSGGRDLAKSLATPRGALATLGGLGVTGAVAGDAPSVDEQVALDSKTRPAIVQKVGVEEESIMSLPEYREKHPSAKQGDYTDYALKEGSHRAGARADAAGTRAEVAGTEAAKTRAKIMALINKHWPDHPDKEALYKGLKAKFAPKSQSAGDQTSATKSSGNTKFVASAK